MVKNENTYYDRVVRYVKNNKIFVLLLFSYLVLTSGGTINSSIRWWGDTSDYLQERFGPKNISSDVLLYNYATTVSQDLINFTGERESNEPDIVNFWSNMSWGERMIQDEKYSKTTEQIYKLRFLSNITLLKSEFLKRGIINGKLDYYENPAGAYPYENIATGLIEMAHQLNSSVKFGT